MKIGMKAAAFSIVFLLSISAIAFANGWVVLQDPDIDLFVKTYNDNIDKVPSVVKGLIANEKITVDIEGYKPFWMETKEGRIVNSGTGSHASPTAILKIKSEVFDSIKTGKMDLLNDFLKGNITIDGVGITGTLKFWFTKLLISLFSFLFAGK